MDEADDRLAPVSYLFGARDADARPSSASSASLSDHDDEAEWNDAWGSEIDDACARLTDAETEKLSMKALGRRSLSRRRP